MRFCDSHVHLSDYARPETLVDFAEWNKSALFSAGVGRSTSLRTLKLAESHPNVVFPFVGVHPSEAEREADLSWLGPSLKEAAGAGEMGLDPKYSEVGVNSAQMRAFKAQLESAERMSKPVQVHSRGAETESLDTLSAFRNSSVLMHWFEGEERLRTTRDRGYFISFGPALLYSKRLKRMAASYDRDKVLTETDGPVSYGPLEAAQGPCLIPSVLFELSRLWRTTFDEAREQVLSNAWRYLGMTKVNHPTQSGESRNWTGPEGSPS